MWSVPQIVSRKLELKVSASFIFVWHDSTPRRACVIKGGGVIFCSMPKQITLTPLAALARRCYLPHTPVCQFLRQAAQQKSCEECDQRGNYFLMLTSIAMTLTPGTARASTTALSTCA